MKFKRLFVALVLTLLASFMATPAFAGSNDPLFINMTASDSHRATMAIGFGVRQLDRGHPLTIFLNDRGVLVASQKNAAEYAEQQKLLTDAIKKGAAVYVCPSCMKHYGVPEGDLLPGTQVSNPELIGSALFEDGTKTLSW
ncbi:MAG: DsrE family protein [Bdellovibrionaceae bacterium]|nr:DsrE family protein [Pseudobdellovibrionaceae bacterium]